jgi:hypothetical protein
MPLRWGQDCGVTKRLPHGAVMLRDGCDVIARGSSCSLYECAL